MESPKKQQESPFHIKKIWGEATGFLTRYQKIWWIDLVLLFGLIGLIFGMINVAGEWTGVHRPTIDIDLSPWALPKYTFFSLCRGMIAYILSLLFTFAYGYWAAKDHIAEKVLIPMLDILQSIPVLGFMPPLTLAMVALFPNSNIGLELVAVIMIFTGQVWNMTFSFYQSLRSIPQYLQEAAAVYRFNWFAKATKLEIPFSAIGLIWNSMMSMAGGWFFLTVSESFQLGDKDFRLPGLGSYMSVAADKGDDWAKLYGVIAMIFMIVCLDQLLWRPMVVWGQKFRVEEGGGEEGMSSWFLDFLRSSQILQFFQNLFKAKQISSTEAMPPADKPVVPVVASSTPRSGLGPIISILAFIGLLGLMAFGAWKIILLFSQVSMNNWILIVSEALATLGRVLVAVGLSAIWTIPVGLWIGLSPRLSRIAQPFVQVAASFPAPMLFSYVIFVMHLMGIPLNWGAIALMILGAQWYILFNVMAGAMAIPSDLLEAARMYRITGWQRFTKVYLPGIFPYLVTGMVTSAGGTWNASIVAEYVTDKGQTITAFGLGSQISDAAAKADYPMLAASVVVMSLMVVAFNRSVWKKLYRLAEEKYSLSK
ncbi:MAG TPA: ABC transporter permease subunit [bacterium]|nr:ABC transporter permease subunit [bacterium]